MVLIGVRAVAAVGAGLCSPAAPVNGSSTRLSPQRQVSGTRRGATAPRPVDSS